MMEIMRTKQKRKRIETEVSKAIKNGIVVSEYFLDSRNVIRGVYGLFCEKKNDKYCFYIGRSFDISTRLFGFYGHVTMFNNHDCEKIVPKLIQERINEGWKISIKILAFVEYEGDNYYRDMQRLAFAEYKLIEEYQEKGECLYQLPEGTWIKEENWNTNYRKNM